MLSWPYPLLRLFAGLSFFWYTYGWLVAKSKLFISPCLLSFFLSSFALMFRLFHHYYLLFFHSRHARFIDWLLSDVADQKRPDHEADIADRELSPLCRCALSGCGPRLCPYHRCWGTYIIMLLDWHLATVTEVGEFRISTNQFVGQISLSVTIVFMYQRNRPVLLTQCIKSKIKHVKKELC